MKKAINLFLLVFISAGLFIACSNDDALTNNSGNNNGNGNSNGSGNGNNGNNTTLTEQQKVFQEFWDIYDKHYPLMHRKSIIWQEVYDTYYPQITSTTTDNQLFGFFNTIMSTIIKDGHAHVEYNTSQFAGFEPEMNENIENMLANTASKIAFQNGSTSNQYLSYGTLVSDSSIGYIQSKQFEPLTNNEESEFNAFKSIVDEALTALQNKTGIIVDVRTNGGGQGPFAYYLAGRFFNTNNTIELIRQRIKTSVGSTVSSLGDWATTPFEGYADSRVEGGYVAGVFPEDNSISKSGTFQFTNKVALLTANGTASAAEYFTAAMKTQNHVKSFGDKTFGIYAGSDIFTLNNGNGKWKTRVSTHDVEVKYNGTFQSFEGIGITPDEVIIPTTIDVNAGKDTHIEAAVLYLNN